MRWNLFVPLAVSALFWDYWAYWHISASTATSKNKLTDISMVGDTLLISVNG